MDESLKPPERVALAFCTACGAFSHSRYTLPAYCSAWAGRRFSKSHSHEIVTAPYKHDAELKGKID